MTSPREALLQQAIGYYAEHGVRDTSLRTLAAAVGTSQRMLHHHFGGREDLLAAVVEAVTAAELRVLEQFADDEDPFDLLERHWARVRDAARTFGPLYFELATHAMHRRPYAEPFVEVALTRYADAFTRVYATLTDAEHATRLSRLSLAVGRGALFDLLLDDDVAAADAAVEEFTLMVRRRLGARGGED